MDQRILIGGAVAVGAYFWWASRSASATPSTVITKTPSTTANGVGFDIGALLGNVKNAIITKQPDQLAGNQAPAQAKTPGPTAAADTPPASWTPGDGGPGATPAANSRRILDSVLENARASDQYITNLRPGGAAYLWDIVQDPGQIAKYDAIKDFATQAYDGSAGSVAVIAAKAKETGTSLADIGTALGMTDADAAGYFQRAGVAF